MLCQKLLDRGHDPATRLTVYRGGVLALRVRSIGEAASLEINSKGDSIYTARCGAYSPADAKIRLARLADKGGRQCELGGKLIGPAAARTTTAMCASRIG
jgi:hypothetical protein